MSLVKYYVGDKIERGQDRNVRINVILCRVLATTVAVEKQ